MLQFAHDLRGRGGPDERVTPPVIVLHEGVDFGHQVRDAAKGAPPDGALGDDAEPDLDLVEPGPIGRSVVDVEAGAASQRRTLPCLCVP